MDIDDVCAGLRRFIADCIGSSATLGDCRVSDGHAGLTFLFEIAQAGTRNAYVIKLAPAGVRRRGNTDVYRQAPLQRALHAAGLPVPAVPWAYEDNPWFDVPFIVMQRLPGQVFFVWDPPACFSRRADDCTPLWEATARTLADLHRFDWQVALADWEQPESLTAQITRWERIYAQAPEPAWAAAAQATERALLDSLPEGTPIGLFHGDYQPGNVLFQDGQLSGVIDWEISGIGARLLDIGWLMMSADRANWVEGWMPIHAPAPARLRALYEAGMGRSYSDIPWYQALAGYRLACIACLNVKLHRKGQRHDPIWEHMGHCVLPMLARARVLLATA
jgi:aminoglycoside phosphotransferase (APT) family kinase protein